TRDRGELAASAVRSILACSPPARAVWIVDQSRDGRTADALAGLVADGSVRYLRSSTKGLSRAHNLAITRTDTDLVAITDDDCEVPGDWLDQIARGFALDPRVGVVFGAVAAGEHDAAAGYVPAYSRDAPFLARSPRDKWRIEGMGACMAIRRSTWESLGGFDERLGPGADFPAAGEGDFAYRALRSRWWIYDTPAIEVLHHGFRSTAEGRVLLVRYARGTGAMMIKHLRCGTPGAARLLGRMAWRWARRRRPLGLRLGSDDTPAGRLGGFARGFAAGAVARIDRDRCLYREDPLTREVE
ncbi:MAG TPA: glycosyltransferase, partial [Gemmatimonadota bacterium]|nr:glycosyltransferase [Gemmatimonadota bacterium]